MAAVAVRRRPQISGERSNRTRRSPMATGPAVLLPLLTKARVDAGPATDRDLLHRFARDGDEAAFTALVRRHAAMVTGTCRRVLGDPGAADDAGQATFLLL